MCLFVTVEFSLMKFQINNIIVILGSLLDFFWKFTLMSFFLGVALVAGVFVICLGPWYYSKNVSNEGNVTAEKDENDEKRKNAKSTPQRKSIINYDNNNDNNNNSTMTDKNESASRNSSPVEMKLSSSEMQLLKTFCYLIKDQNIVDQTGNTEESSATIVPNSSASGIDGKIQSAWTTAEDTANNIPEPFKVKVRATLGGPLLPEILVSHVTNDDVHVDGRVHLEVEDSHATDNSSSRNVEDGTIEEETVIEASGTSAGHFALKSTGGGTVFRNSLTNEVPEQVRDLGENVSEYRKASSVRENVPLLRERGTESSRFRKSVILAGKIKSWSTSWRDHSSATAHAELPHSLSQLKPPERQSTMLDIRNHFVDAQTSSNASVSIDNNNTVYKSLLFRKTDAGKISKSNEKEENSEKGSEDTVSISNQLQITNTMIRAISEEFDSSSNTGSSATEYFDASADYFYDNSNLPAETNSAVKDLDESKGEESTDKFHQSVALSASEVYQSRDETFQKDKHTFKKFCKSLPTRLNKVKMTRGFHFKDNMLVHEDKGKIYYCKEEEIVKSTDS